MKKIWILLLCICMLAGGCSQKKEVDLNSETAKAEQQQFDQFLDDEFVRYLKENKFNAHFAWEDLSVYGLENMEATLGDPADEVDYDAMGNAIKKLESMDRALLTDDQKNLYDRYLDFLKLNVQYEAYGDYQFIFTPGNGLQDSLITMFTEYELRNETDVQDVIAYLSEVRDYFDGCMKLTQEQYDKGICQPDGVIEDIIAGCERFLSKRDDNQIYVILSKGLDQMEGLDDQKKAEYKKQIKAAVQESVIPAYEDLIAFYEGLKGKATNNGALANWEDGKKYYELLLKDKTSTNMSVDEISKALEEEIDQEFNEMYQLLLADQTLIDQFMDVDYGSEDAEEILKLLNDSLHDAYPEIGTPEYTVSYLDPSVANESIAAYYLNPPMDHFNHNVIKVNPDAVSDLFITLAHEGFPGHCYQNMYELNHNYHPLLYFMNFIGYSEGWAVYTEMDSLRYSAIKNENLAELIRINSAMSYLIVSYIDIQINYYGWTYEQTREYCETWGFDTDVIYNAVIGDPCLYAPYGFGYLKFKQLRTKTEETLGDAFDAKEYHKVILDCGTSMFEYVEAQVDAYVKAKQ